MKKYALALVMCIGSVFGADIPQYIPSYQASLGRVLCSYFHDISDFDNAFRSLNEEDLAAINAYFALCPSELCILIASKQPTVEMQVNTLFGFFLCKPDSEQGQFVLDIQNVTALSDDVKNRFLSKVQNVNGANNN